MSDPRLSQEDDEKPETVVIARKGGKSKVYHRPHPGLDGRPACLCNNGRDTEYRTVERAAIEPMKRPCENRGCFGL